MPRLYFQKALAYIKAGAFCFACPSALPGCSAFFLSLIAAPCGMAPELSCLPGMEGGAALQGRAVFIFSVGAAPGRAVPA